MHVCGDVPSEKLQAFADTTDHQVLMAKWTAAGKLRRYSLNRMDAVRILCGAKTPVMPRPGDWFCNVCQRRNMAVHFFCCSCGPHVLGATANAPGTAHIPGGSHYVRPTDWGCGYCYGAMCSWSKHCTNCGRAKENAIPPLVAKEAKSEAPIAPEVADPESSAPKVDG